MSDALKPALHGRDHCPGGIDPIPCLAGTFPWAIITDGGVQTNSGVTYPVGGQYYGSNDTDSSYYTFTQRNTTYPGIGSYDYFTVNVVQRGLYLLDGQMTIESWGTVAGFGYATFDLNPNLEAWYPFGFGVNEADAWVDKHATHEIGTAQQVASFFRVTGIASLDASTEFFPSFAQVTGANNLSAAFNYLKIVRLQDYEAIGDLVTGSVI